MSFTPIDPEKPYLTIPVDSSKVSSMMWGPLDHFIVTGHENGELVQWDTKARTLITAD